MALLFIAVLALTIGGLGLFMVELIRLGIDYTRLRAMYVLSNARPRSGAEAVQQLHSFRTEAGKTRFVHALRAWVPVGQDSQLLADEADLQKGTVRDALFELVEVWREAESK
jgi:hypothetical protein